MTRLGFTSEPANTYAPKTLGFSNGKFEFEPERAQSCPRICITLFFSHKYYSLQEPVAVRLTKRLAFRRFPNIFRRVVRVLGIWEPVLRLLRDVNLAKWDVATLLTDWSVFVKVLVALSCPAEICGHKASAN